MIVVDASVVVPALVSSSGLGASAREVMAVQGAHLAAPALLDVEVSSAFRRLERSGEIPSATAEGGVTVLEGMRIERFTHEPLLRRIWELRHNVTPYDAAYVAVAEYLEAPLVTLDSRLAKASGIRCDVRMLSP
jgi:predicted nucleic acid-binding protein